MATLTELYDLHSDGPLTKKVAAALMIEAQNLIEKTPPTAAEKAYAVKVFADPLTEAHRMLKSVIAANSAASVAAIQGASDSTIQTNVAASVPLFVDADAGV